MQRARSSVGKVIIRVLGVAAVASVALALTACNTVKGAGQDLQEASENTSDAVGRAVNGN